MKKLLFSFLVAGTACLMMNAQSKTWDFSDTSKFPAGAISTDKTVDGLSFVTGGSNLTIATNSLATFDDGYTPTQRLQFGGNSYSGSTNPALGSTSLPTRRYLQFAVSNNAVIKLWARGGGAGRSIIISDQSGKVLSSTAFAGSSATDIAVVTYNYTGAAGNLLISTGAGDNSLYKIEYTDNATLAVSASQNGLGAKVVVDGKKIHVKGVDSKMTSINVVSANGVLVKSLKTSVDTVFELSQTGMYIVNVTSDRGSQKIKILLK